MFSQAFLQAAVDILVVFATDILIPLMAFTFAIGAVLRILNYYVLSREEYFANEFQKRIDSYLSAIDENSEQSFFAMLKRLLTITYYEIYEVAAIYKRRKPDAIMSVSDRIFLTKSGFAWLVKDLLKTVRYMKFNNSKPKLLEVSKKVFQNNPCFTKIFGYIPSGIVNDVTNLLPGLFIIGGIFGTFLGIMKALPDLGGMNLEDVEGTKMIMDGFLLKISFSMSTSIVGIVLSFTMTILNAFFSAEKVFMRTIEKFESSLDELWNRSSNNDLPSEALKFDENKDPLEALANEALNKEYQKMRERFARKPPSGPQKEQIPKAS